MGSALATALAGLDADEPEGAVLDIGLRPPRLYNLDGATVMVDDGATGGGGATADMPGPAAGEGPRRLVAVLEQPARPKAHREMTKDLDKLMLSILS